MRRILSLCDSEWRCAESHQLNADVAELEHIEAQGIPASVPGEVRLDLARAGLLEGDPFYGRNSETSRWVEERDWWYWRDFELALQPGQRAWLWLRGADYITWTYLNGHLLGRHEGMFSHQVHEITHLLRRRNRLAVRFLAPARFPHHRSALWERLLNRIEDSFSALGDYPDRRDVLKCQMSFGWDFAPALRTIGLWDEVDIVVTGRVALWDAQAIFHRQENRLQVAFDADAAAPGAATFVLSLAGQTFECEPLVQSFDAVLPAGRSHWAFDLIVPEPRLWFPWDRLPPHAGDRPPLYTLTIETRQEGQAQDRITQSVGLREITLRRNPGSPPDVDDWTFVINGQPLYVRGANWVPADAFPARVTENDYRALLDMARAANLNALRVWGGGLREKKAFYDLCDQMGLLVWQEFPLACAFLTRYPRSPDYLNLVEREARSIVRQLRHHPSLILWCGGNEFSPERNRPVIETMRRVVMDQDGARPFQEASPSGGESHNWRVWHEFHPPEAYQRDAAQLMSEFGLQAPPVIASLHRFIPPDELWPPGPSWIHHRAQMNKLLYYARPFQISDLQSPLSTFVISSQRAQARGIHIAVEHARRNKYATSGFLVWQLNSPWPAIDWALVDYYRAPKLAYFKLAEIANPLLVSLDYALRRYLGGDTFAADVWIVNDWLREFPGCRVEITMEQQTAKDEGQISNTQAFDVNVKPDSAEVIGRVEWIVPAGDLRITCRLLQGERTLSTNSYDLSKYDGRYPSWASIISNQARTLFIGP